MSESRMICRCGECGHIWPALLLPMDIEKVAKVMKRIFCPNCAELKRIYPSNEQELARVEV